LGFIARLTSSYNITNKAAFSVQSILLTLGPTLLMFTVNLSMSPFVRTLHADSLLLIPIQYQFHAYIPVTIAAFLIQLIGTVLSTTAQTRPTAELASKLIIASYVIDIFWWFSIFIENVIWSIGLSKSSSSLKAAALKIWPHWKRWNQLFGLATMIIFGRNLMRLTATGMGPEGFLSVNEWPSYAFDGYQMVVVMGAWGVFYLPGKCVFIERREGENWTELGE
jgi:hypothetical protein